MFKSGFTLIEILLVVAIIGFLVSLTIVNSWGIRAQANDAQIQTLMHQVRNAAELDYQRRGSYSQICNESDDTLRDNDYLKPLEEAIEEENGGRPVRCYEGTGKTSFAASSPFMAKIGKHWCIDSAGLSAELDYEIISAKCE